jgi:hypothetical protein
MIHREKSGRSPRLYPAGERYVAGEAIGILIIDCLLPLPPGDVANATTYPFPVRYRIVKAASSNRLIYERDPSLLPLFIEAGWELVREGVKALTGDCGYLALFQEELANEFPVPVFMSSLLQIPFIHRTLCREEKVGIIAADSRYLTEQHLQSAGIDKSMPVKIVGMEDKPNFYSAIVGQKGVLDFEIAEAEVVSKAKELVASDDKVKAILLECSDLPPYAAAIQEAVNLPVFDFNTMINYVFSALVRYRYEGFV